MLHTTCARCGRREDFRSALLGRSSARWLGRCLARCGRTAHFYSTGSSQGDSLCRQRRGIRHPQKVLRVQDLQSHGNRFVSCTWRATRTKVYPQILLKSPGNPGIRSGQPPFEHRFDGAAESRERPFGADRRGAAVAAPRPRIGGNHLRFRARAMYEDFNFSSRHGALSSPSAPGPLHRDHRRCDSDGRCLKGQRISACQDRETEQQHRLQTGGTVSDWTTSYDRNGRAVK